MTTNRPQLRFRSGTAAATLALLSLAPCLSVAAEEGSLQSAAGGTGSGNVEAPIIQKVLVLNYDPVFEGQRLHEVFRWNDPRGMARDYIEDMGKASGGLLKIEIAEWRDIDEIYAREDGGRFTVEEYVRNRRTNSGWPAKFMADYPRIMSEQKVVPMVDDGRVDEVWVFSDHFFGIWEASMAGPGAFFVNGGVYPKVPSQRPFAFFGFNYERGVAEMIHNTSHRTECTMNRVYGQWNLKSPKNNWEKFSTSQSLSGGPAGVGTCHRPANALHDYDYGNLREVDSWADDFLNYPNLTGRTKKVSVTTWSPPGADAHRDYMKWYFARFPRAHGVNPDGKLNNWWRYLYDFDNYTADGKPRPASAGVVRVEALPGQTNLAVAYRSAAFIDPRSCDVGDLSLTLDSGSALKPAAVSVSDDRPGGYRVATYRFPAVTGMQLAAATVRLHADQVKDLSGTALAQTSWSFALDGADWKASVTVPDKK